MFYLDTNTARRDWFEYRESALGSFGFVERVFVRVCFPEFHSICSGSRACFYGKTKLSFDSLWFTEGSSCLVHGGQFTGGRTNEQTDKRTHGQSDGRQDDRAGASSNGQLHGLTSGWAWASGRTHDGTNGRARAPTQARKLPAPSFRNLFGKFF